MSIQDQFPDDLSDDDWDTLGNILLAYIWNDNYKNILKGVEESFLSSRHEDTQETIKYLRRLRN
jgi:hypothetical protein